MKNYDGSYTMYEQHYLATMITLSKNKESVDIEIINAIVNQMIGYLHAGIMSGFIGRDEYLQYMSDLNSLLK